LSDLKHCFDICLEGLSEILKTQSQDNIYHRQNSNREPPRCQRVATWTISLDDWMSGIVTDYSAALDIGGKLSFPIPLLTSLRKQIEIKYLNFYFRV
jgi:hypothetical protein